MTVADAKVRLAFGRQDIERTIGDRFEEVARECSDRLALTGDDRSWTFCDLNRAVNRIAHAIQERTPSGPGRIAYLVRHSPEMVIATLAVLKAGKTYVAIHPRFPTVAQAEILKDVEPQLLVTSSALASVARTIGTCPILVLDEEVDDRYPADTPPLVTRPDDVSTLFYTSGSTGRPKGVVKSHRAVMHRVWLAGQYDQVTVADRQSLLTHCSFSASESDMFGALLHGAAVCTFDIASHGFGEFGSWLESKAITLLHPPVLFFRRFLSTLDGPELFPNVRIVALAGDVVLPADLQKWNQHFSRACVIFHRFSITETALLSVARIDHSTVLAVDGLDAGQRVPDKELTLVDRDGKPVAEGEIGELVVKSEYLADGYWKHDEETKAAFQPDPDVEGRRIFRTGDLGRFLSDGRFVFLGRQDYQVKMRGYRVDTREIEAALLQIEGVREVACISWKERDEPRLRAFIVWKTGQSLGPSAIRTRLREVLPEWKIPDEFHSIPALPTTLTDKIDRRLLIEQASTTRPDRDARPEQFGEPWTSLAEETVARIYRRVLRLKWPVGRDGDFFDLGGNSLLLTELQLELETRFGGGLALRDLLKDTTVRGVGALIERRQSTGSGRQVDPSFLPLRSGSAEPPLFIVHGAGGLPTTARHVLDALGRNQAIYGFRAKGFDGAPPPKRIEDMAANYISVMRRMQPEGPYMLCGFCAGGIVAVEMGRQLHAAGAQVAPLLLIDPPAPPSMQPLPAYAIKLGVLLSMLRFTHVPFVRAIARRTAAARLQSPAAMRVWLRFRIAAYRYSASYDGPADVVGSSARIAEFQRGLWKRFLTGRVSLVDVGRTHVDVFRPGNEKTRDILMRCIEADRAWCDDVQHRATRPVAI